jgi:hypothetical protein
MKPPTLDEYRAGYMARRGFRAMSAAQKRARTVQPKAKTIAARKKSYASGIEAVRRSQESRRST